MDLADPACDIEGMWLSYFEKCGIGVGDEFYLDMDMSCVCFEINISMVDMIKLGLLGKLFGEAWSGDTGMGICLMMYRRLR
jgi:hypothetical protein